MRALWLVVATSSGLAGCGTVLNLDSSPTGALVTQPSTGTQWVMPTQLSYASLQPGPDGCAVADPLVVTWASGASLDYRPRLCGDSSVFNEVVQRPDAPGLSTDVQAAQQRLGQVQAVQAVQAQAAQAAASQAAYNLGYALGGGSSPGYAPPAPRQAPVRRIPQPSGIILPPGPVTMQPGCSYSVDGTIVQSFC